MKRINISIKCYYIMITNAIYTEPMGTKENPYPITPPVKDRERGKYYIYKNEVRYWNGYRVVNKEKESKRKKEYREKHKEKVKEYNKKYCKEYRGKHKEELNRKKKEYYKNNKEKFKDYRKNNKERIKKQRKEYHEKHKEKLNKQSKEYREKNKEGIKKQRKEYLENNKQKVKKQSKEYREKNKEGIKKQRKEYNEKHKEKIKKRKKEYHEKHKEKLNKQSKEYNENHRKERNEYKKKKYNKDPIYRLKALIRGRTLKALKAQNASKNQRTMEYVNCSVADLYNHIESQFGNSGMNWDNSGNNCYGNWYCGRGWEIDHRRPCESFDLNDEEQKYMCFHWTNLQPMWGQENNEKYNDYDPETFQYKWINREIGWVGIPSYLMN